MFLNKSLDITPTNVEALLNKGFILERIDEIEESNECYDEILAIDPNNKFALNNKSGNLVRMGKFKDAIIIADRALEVDPNFIHAIANKANSLKGLKKSPEAIAFLDDKIELVDKSIILQSIKVDLYIDVLDLKEAQRVNQEILLNDPDNVEALNRSGAIYDRNSYMNTTTNTENWR